MEINSNTRKLIGCPKKYILVIILFLFSLNIISAQDKEGIDSISKIVRKITGDNFPAEKIMDSILMFKDHYFEYSEVSSPDYGRFILKGTFKRQHDSLILFAGNSFKGDTCTFITTGLSTIAIDTMARIVISVYDTWGFPLDRPLFIVKDSANNAV